MTKIVPQELFTDSFFRFIEEKTSYLCGDSKFCTFLCKVMNGKYFEHLI